MINSYFSGNKAIYGGAINLLDTTYIEMENNTFFNNSAISLVQGESEGEGGAIYYACDPDSDFNYDCDVVLRNNTF